MSWETTTSSDSSGVKSVYAFDSDRPEQTFLVYKIDPSTRSITYYPRDDFFVKEVLLEGFTDLPEEFADAGYMRGGAQYYLNKKLKGRSVKKFVISGDKVDSFRKIRGKSEYRVVLSYASFRKLKKGLTAIATESKQEKSAFADDIFGTMFPTRYKRHKQSAKRRAKRLLSNLDKSVISELGPKDVDAILDFLRLLVSTRYEVASKRLDLFSAAKMKVDEVALADVIARFEKLLAEDPPEATWGEFLRRNLFLVDSKYIRVIPELNVVLASQRKVDFGLIDAQGYLDLFEIKKPSTKLLAARKDRGNFYWHTQAVKAMAQAEKYLFNAERKAPALMEDINRERDVEVKIVRPRAVIVMGSTKQLADQRMDADFRVLRRSLKNIEIVLYDELLHRLKNQQQKLYLEPALTMESSTQAD